jgi:hypothetical protein
MKYDASKQALGEESWVWFCEAIGFRCRTLYKQYLLIVVVKCNLPLLSTTDVVFEIKDFIYIMSPKTNNFVSLVSVAYRKYVVFSL